MNKIVTLKEAGEGIAEILEKMPKKIVYCKHAGRDETFTADTCPFCTSVKKAKKKILKEWALDVIRRNPKTVFYSSPKSVHLPDTLKHPETAEDYSKLKYIVKTELISKEQAFKMWPELEQPEDERTL